MLAFEYSQWGIPSHSHKTEKYAPLVSDLSQRFIVSFYAIEVSARGQITKENRSRLKSFLLKCCSDPRAILKKVISIASKSALLSSPPFSVHAKNRPGKIHHPWLYDNRLFSFIFHFSCFYWPYYLSFVLRFFFTAAVARLSVICIRNCLPLYGLWSTW